LNKNKRLHVKSHGSKDCVVYVINNKIVVAMFTDRFIMVRWFFSSL